ncbi:head GIN domain-containing protein [Aureivirga marina]|uniref:head GIN domain-containing protein n=1 Tax=Aureivirga marina TaxID=1182451 RepID=UPI0018CA38C5|nr:head GIN domain-containing protein [Aureivirga marina]
MKQLLCVLILFISVTNVNAQWKKIKGNKNLITATREISYFQEIKSKGSFKVILTDGKQGEIEITAEENLMEYIITEVTDNKLSIHYKKGKNIQPRKEIIIKVPIKFINHLTLSGSGEIISEVPIENKEFSIVVTGSGDISLEEVESKNITATLSGSGNLDIAGETNKLKVRISGSADFEGKKLESDKVDITISGSGNATVYANNSLKARVSGSGDIYYKGNPKNIDVKSSGSGNAQKL